MDDSCADGVIRMMEYEFEKREMQDEGQLELVQAIRSRHSVPLAL